MNFLHGDSAGGSFRLAFKSRPEEMIIFHDVLSCGPLTKYNDIEAWRIFREKYWNDLDNESIAESLSYSELDRDFYRNFSQIEEADEYKLWIGTGLSDQLLLAYFVNLLTYHDLGISKLAVYQFEKIRGKKFEATGLGLLNPDQISHHPAPYKLNEEQIEHAKLAWEAVTDNSPEKYFHFMSSDKGALPLMKRAMSYLLYRYPKANNGLSYWDETLLKYSEKYGPNAARIIGYTMTDCMDGLDLVGDFYLLSRLKGMGQPELCRPLIKANALNLPLRETKVTILPDGLKALEGKINIIKENGIDDWICGVHLDSLNKCVWVRNHNDEIVRLND